MSRLDNTFGTQQVTPQEREQKIRRVFKLVASRYDLMNDCMSFGMHRLWKRKFVHQVNASAADRIIDLAGGTGDIARLLKQTGAFVVVADPSMEMMMAGQKSPQQKWLNVAAIGEQLPFASGCMDKLTISFGIRNMTRMDAALAEIYRVLKPGGTFYCLEFSKVSMPLRPFYQLYNRYVIPRLGALVAGQPEAYQYLIESIERFPDQEQMKQIIAQAGFKNVHYHNLFFGIACIHIGVKPIDTTNS